MTRIAIHLAALPLLSLLPLPLRGQDDFEQESRQAVPRDGFPVFDDPAMVSADDAETRFGLRPDDAVLGVSHAGEAKAYPIAVMGNHELGNDTIGGAAITVTW